MSVILIFNLHSPHTARPHYLSSSCRKENYGHGKSFSQYLNYIIQLLSSRILQEVRHISHTDYKSYSVDLNKVIPLCADSIYSIQPQQT